MKTLTTTKSFGPKNVFEFIERQRWVSCACVVETKRAREATTSPVSPCHPSFPTATDFGMRSRMADLIDGIKSIRRLWSSR